MDQVVHKVKLVLKSESSNSSQLVINLAAWSRLDVGREWLIDPKDLEAVKDRKVGRPRKVRKSTR